MNIRIITWNLWWRHSDWRARQQAIRTVLKAENPDICCLQEVWSDPNTNLAQMIADDLELQCTFFPSAQPNFYQRRALSTEVGIGNAILSRWPAVHVEAEGLTAGDGENEGRLIGLAAIATSSGVLPICTTHLNSGITDSAVRVLQVSQIAAFMSRHVPQGLPPVLAGDFNCEPDADEIRIMTGRSKPPQPGFGLRDVWRLVRDDPGATWSRRNPYVERTPQLPDSRIDYVFVGYPSGSADLAVRSCDVIGTGPVDGVWPSDHFGVRVDASLVTLG